MSWLKRVSLGPTRVGLYGSQLHDLGDAFIFDLVTRQRMISGG